MVGGLEEEVRRPGLEEVPLVALSSLLLHLDHPSILSLSSSSSTLRASVASLTLAAEMRRGADLVRGVARPLTALTVVVEEDEEVIKELLKVLPRVEEMVGRMWYKVGCLRMVVEQGGRREVEGRRSGNVLSCWGHHLLGHHLLAKLLALHSSTSKLLATLDLQLDVHCESCSALLSLLQEQACMAPAYTLTLRLVSLCFPERPTTLPLLTSLLATLAQLKGLKKLRLLNLDPEMFAQLESHSADDDKFSILPSDTLGQLAIRFCDR